MKFSYYRFDHCVHKNWKEVRIAYKFEAYKDKRGEFRFRFKAPNGDNMFSSEGYKQKSSVMNAIESIKKNTPSAEVDDQS